MVLFEGLDWEMRLSLLGAREQWMLKARKVL